MKKIPFLVLILLGMNACQSGATFTIEGNISNADGKTIYLEAMEIDRAVMLDSAKLGNDGAFTFKHQRPECPEFYRLRITDRVINLSIDSTETVVVKAPYEGFITDYTVTGSPDCEKIKELTLKQIQLQQSVNALLNNSQNTFMGDALQNRVNALLNAYKEDVKTKYIYAAPNTASAYFALFQQVNGYPIFDPMNSKEDVRCFGAVATSWNNFYPHAIRTKNLINLTLKGMRNTREPKEKTLEISADKIKETSIIDIKLRDIRGKEHTLTELKGKVVLLDFTVFQTPIAATHNYWLRDIYNKYASKGFEIYQVSLDADEHFWKTNAENLPWVCVRDPNGIYSSYASLYSVKEVPTYFLINRQNVLTIRGENIKDVDAEIKKLL